MHSLKTKGHFLINYLEIEFKDTTVCNPAKTYIMKNLIYMCSYQ